MKILLEDNGILSMRGGKIAYDAKVYQVSNSSLSDGGEEKKAISNAIKDWNAMNSCDSKIVLLPVIWETHATPSLADRHQAITNKQLVKPSDVLIVVFWSRIGAIQKFQNPDLLRKS